jgi:4-amino-4-deoxy-L-arabinose transferase-like glycosyltransferase
VRARLAGGRGAPTPTGALGRAAPTTSGALVLLALPFLVAIAALRGLTVGIDTFHATDELAYHVPTVLRFAHQLPGIELHSYPAAQTPLFHVLFALAGKVVGFELWRLRLLDAIVSWGAAVVLWAFLRRQRGLEPGAALALALLFALSPYAFGVSFLVMTDGLAMLLAIATIAAAFRYAADGRTATLAVTALLVALAVLTRQSLVWLAPVAVLLALLARPRAPELLRSGAAMAIALVPFGLLVLNWHGLTPPGSDPSSCGLCSGDANGRHLSTGLSLRPAELTVALVGLYGAVLLAPLGRRALPRERIRWAALGAAIGLLVVALSSVGTSQTDAGYIWKVAGRLPALHGTSLAFWLLVPLGGAFLGARWRRDDPLPYVVLGWFLVSSVATRLLYQKYFDPIALLVVIFAVHPRELVRGKDLAGAAVLAAGFVAYALSFA